MGFEIAGNFILVMGVILVIAAALISTVLSGSALPNHLLIDEEIDKKDKDSDQILF